MSYVGFLVPECAEGLGDLLLVVEVVFYVADDLVGFVPFPREENHIPGRRLLHCLENGGCPVFHNQGRAREAEAEYGRSLAINPNNVRALVNLGLLQLNGGAPEAAVAALRSALALDPGSAEARHFLARALGATGRYEEACAEFERLVATSARDVAVLEGYALALIAAGRKAEGIRMLRRAEALNPGDPAIERALREAGDPDGAA